MVYWIGNEFIMLVIAVNYIIFVVSSSIATVVVEIWLCVCAI